MNNEELVAYFEDKFNSPATFLISNGITGEVVPYIRDKDLDPLPISERVQLQWLVDQSKVFSSIFLFC